MQELHINIQNQTEVFLHESTENTAYTLRVYVYQELNGVVTPITLSASQTAKFFYFVDRESSEVVEVDGDITAGLTYIDFDFTVAKTAINGRFGASVIIYDALGDPEVQADGQIYLKQNPATGSNTELDTTTIVNWSEITNTGQLPWSVGNDFTLITNCSSSPYSVDILDSGTTFVLDCDCDFQFNLPQIQEPGADANVYSSTHSMVFSFIQKNNAYTMALKAYAGDSIDDSSDGGTKVSIRNHGGGQIPGATVYVRPISTTKWYTIWADSAFETT